MTAERPATYTRSASPTACAPPRGGRPRRSACSDGRRRSPTAQLVDRMDRVANAAVHGMGLRPRRPRGDHVAPNCHRVRRPSCSGSPRSAWPPRWSTPARRRASSRTSATTQRHVSSSCTRRSRRSPATASLASVERIVVHRRGVRRAGSATLARARPPRRARGVGHVLASPTRLGTTGNAEGRPAAAPLPGAHVLRDGHRVRLLRPATIARWRSRPMFHGAGFAFAVAPIFFGGFCAICTTASTRSGCCADSTSWRSRTSFMVPTHFSGDLRARRRDADATAPRPALTTIISNAAPLPQAMKERIVEYFGDGRAVRGYGSTEAGIVSNLRPAGPAAQGALRRAPVPVHGGPAARRAGRGGRRRGGRRAVQPLAVPLQRLLEAPEPTPPGRCATAGSPPATSRSATRRATSTSSTARTTRSSPAA